MPMETKEEKIMKAFFNHPSKQWHFDDLLSEIGIARSNLAKWLLRLKDKGLIKRIKPNGKMPYFIANFESPEYKSRKRIFALEKMHDCGLLPYLQARKESQLLILFGSFSRSDWNHESDIDIFALGDFDETELSRYSNAIGREIELHKFDNINSLKKINSGLMKNVFDGYVIKGHIAQIGEQIWQN